MLIVLLALSKAAKYQGIDVAGLSAEDASWRVHNMLRRVRVCLLVRYERVALQCLGGLSYDDHFDRDANFSSKTGQRIISWPHPIAAFG